MTRHLVIHALYYITFRFLQIFPYMKLVKALTYASKIIPCLYTIKYKKLLRMITCSKYKAEPFSHVNWKSEVTERLSIMCPCSLFFCCSTGNTIHHWKREPKSIQTWMKKNPLFYKRNPFLKTAAKEKLPAGLMVWPAKPTNMEMFIKWQRPGVQASLTRVCRTRGKQLASLGKVPVFPGCLAHKTQDFWQPALVMAPYKQIFRT